MSLGKELPDQAGVDARGVRFFTLSELMLQVQLLCYQARRKRLGCKTYRAIESGQGFQINELASLVSVFSISR